MPKRFNWPFWAGGLLVLLVIGVAWLGPQLAPRDPMETNTVLQVEGEWLSVPFPPGTPGFPLGTDDHGRDLLSRLLWGVRPTLTIVALAAVLRLLLGAMVGLVSGWSSRWPGRLLDSLIAGALAIPALMVALGVVAALRGELGAGAFIVGLALTGWAESARIVREQVRIVRGNLYVEAARALGGSDLHILGRHIVRQIAPLLGMLLAFEFSSTLLTLAGLGFLGYFVGGEIWVAISDFVAQRFSGAPELGQMLQTNSGELFTGPWKIFATGGTIFLMVLAFNLLGEGLRRRAQEEHYRPSRLAHARRALGEWLEANSPFDRWSTPQRGALLAGLVGLLLLGGWLWQRTQAEAGPAPALALEMPGGHLWPTERGDPYGTLWREVAGPSKGQIVWELRLPAALTGGPAIDAAGRLYVTTRDQRLHAISPSGETVWETLLPTMPVGVPALGPEGELYVADEGGGLIALAPDGSIRWQHTPPTPSLPAGAGPIVAPDGMIYYTVGSSVKAMSPEGLPLWEHIATIAPVYVPPQLSPDGRFVMLERGLLERESGQTVESPLLNENRPFQFFIGADGRSYYRHDNQILQWEGTDSEAAPIKLAGAAEWDPQRFGGIIPRESGVTRDQIVWMIAWNPFQDARLFWLDFAANKMLGSIIYPHRPSRLIAIDSENNTYTCGLNLHAGPECLAHKLGEENPLWSLPVVGEPNGGALVAGRLYVTTTSGSLYAIGE